MLVLARDLEPVGEASELRRKQQHNSNSNNNHNNNNNNHNHNNRLQQNLWAGPQSVGIEEFGFSSSQQKIKADDGKWPTTRQPSADGFNCTRLLHNGESGAEVETLQDRSLDIWQLWQIAPKLPDSSQDSRQADEEQRYSTSTRIGIEPGKSTTYVAQERDQQGGLVDLLLVSSIEAAEGQPFARNIGKAAIGQTNKTSQRYRRALRPKINRNIWKKVTPTRVFIGAHVGTWAYRKYVNWTSNGNKTNETSAATTMLPLELVNLTTIITTAVDEDEPTTTVAAPTAGGLA